PDATQCTIKLRQGVKWTDGEPFTADDVIWTLMTYFSGKLVPPPPLYEWESVDGVPEFRKGSSTTIPGLIKVDDYTVQIKLSKPNVSIRATIANFHPQPKHVWQNEPLDTINKS